MSDGSGNPEVARLMKVVTDYKEGKNYLNEQLVALRATTPEEFKKDQFQSLSVYTRQAISDCEIKLSVLEGLANPSPDAKLQIKLLNEAIDLGDCCMEKDNLIKAEIKENLAVVAAARRKATPGSAPKKNKMKAQPKPVSVAVQQREASASVGPPATIASPSAQTQSVLASVIADKHAPASVPDLATISTQPTAEITGASAAGREEVGSSDDEDKDEYEQEDDDDDEEEDDDDDVDEEEDDDFGFVKGSDPAGVYKNVGLDPTAEYTPQELKK